MTVACALIPRFTLLAILEERRRALLTRPLALAPEPGGPQVVGEASGPAEAFGVRAGMRLGEALARCPELTLVPPDPERAEAAWEEALRRLEAIGAAVEPGRPGEAFFEAGRPAWALGRKPGGGPAGGRGRQSAHRVRLGAGQTRLCAYAAALRARPRRAPVVVPGAMARAFLAPLPVGLLRERLPGNRAAPAGGAEEAARIGSADLPEKLERLGVDTLGQLAALPDAAIADRFGEAGLRALRMARGTDEPLRPRRAHEELVERLELHEAISGPQLERALSLLVDRLLAHPARRGRSLRRLRLGVRLAGGGSWRSVAAMRRASADPTRLRLALLPKLEELPGPAASLSLQALETGPPASDQAVLAESAHPSRRKRLAEAVRQARAVAGKDAVLRVLEVDSESRVPERRSLLLTPVSEEDGATTRCTVPPCGVNCHLVRSVTGRRNVYWPRPVRVDAGSDGVPSAVESVAVDAVREEWLVEDRWWTPRPLRRRYFELVLADGRNVVVFCEPASAAGSLVPAKSMNRPPAPRPNPRERRPDRRDGRSESPGVTSSSTATPPTPSSTGRRRRRSWHGRRRELGYPALALTDHDGVWGAMEFAQACKSFGVRPIVGAELTVTAGGRPLSPDAPRRGRHRVAEPVPPGHGGSSRIRVRCRDREPLPPASAARPRSSSGRRAWSASRAARATGRSRARFGRAGGRPPRRRRGGRPRRSGGGW